ncbi:MAG: hypothetical protein ABEJ65_07790, partial [bacterium]
MKRKFVVPLLALFFMVGMMVFMSGCNPETNNKTPESYRIEYEWIEGSVPPPDHYRYRIILESGEKPTLYYWP